jgi:hypothetical protein
MIAEKLLIERNEGRGSVAWCIAFHQQQRAKIVYNSLSAEFGGKTCAKAKNLRF